MLDGRASSINYAAAHIPAILHAWFPGEFCGQAVAEPCSAIIIRGEDWQLLFLNL